MCDVFLEGQNGTKMFSLLKKKKEYLLHKVFMYIKPNSLYFHFHLIKNF